MPMDASGLIIAGMLEIDRLEQGWHHRLATHKPWSPADPTTGRVLRETRTLFQASVLIRLTTSAAHC